MELYLLYGKPTDKPIHFKRDTYQQRLVSMTELANERFDFSGFEGIVEKTLNSHGEKRFHSRNCYLNLILQGCKVITHAKLPDYCGEQFTGSLIEGVFIGDNPLENDIPKSLKSLKTNVDSAKGHVYYRLHDDIPLVYKTQTTTHSQW